MAHLFLADEWISAAREIRERHSHRVPEIGVVLRMNVVATHVPFGDGTVHAHIDTTNGGLAMDLGSLDSPDVTVTTDWETARKLFVDQDPASTMQAFMSGKVKIEGDITKVLALQTSVPQDVDTTDVAEEIRAITA